MACPCYAKFHKIQLITVCDINVCSWTGWTDMMSLDMVLKVETFSFWTLNRNYVSDQRSNF